MLMAFAPKRAENSPIMHILVHSLDMRNKEQFKHLNRQVPRVARNDLNCARTAHRMVRK